MNSHHQEILSLIQKNSGKATQHTFLDSYLGNEHPRYPISAPILRTIAKDWMKKHTEMTSIEFAKLLTSLIEGVSATEKCMAGILLDYSSKDQRQFDPELFDTWLDHLVGWAEVDSVCTGTYTITEISAHWKKWKPLLVRLSKSENIQKRRASIVLLCSPLRKPNHEELVTLALANVDRLKSEKEILITKAISWVLRSMEKNYKKTLKEYMNDNMDSLPKIAVRETMIKLKTGKK